MGFIDFDPDEYEAVYEHTPCHSCGGDMKKCSGRCSGSASYRRVRRSPEAVAEIKRKRSEEREAAILAEADAIRLRRSHSLPEANQKGGERP